MMPLEIAKKTLSFASGDQVEVLVTRQDGSLTRFANSYIHQNVKESNVHITVRVIKGNKQGIATTNLITTEALKEVAQKAGQLSDFSPIDPVERILPGPATYRQIPAPDEATINLTPEARADAIATMVNYAKPLGLTIAGAYSNSHEIVAIANNNAVEAQRENADAELKVTAMGEDSSGQAGISTLRVLEIDPLTVIKEAAGRAIASKNPIEIEPGEYEVILLHYAVAELIGMMGWLGFSARAAENKSSWVAQNMGKKVLSDSFTLIDDPFDPRTSQMPFDFEGTPKKAMTLVDCGVPKTILYDSYYSKKTGNPNTGHALPSSSGYGPAPFNTALLGGNSTVDEMVSHVKKGVLISRFWYTNIMRPLELEFTTMTRDGLFLIENGKIISGLKNMRVTDSMLKIFSGILELENIVRNHEGVIAPAIRCKSINFSSRTKF